MAEYQRKKWVDGEVITDEGLNHMEEGIAGASADATLAKEEVKKKAPTDHASPDTAYGKGDGNKHGHVKLSDSLESDSDADGGVAATPGAVKKVYDEVKNIKEGGGSVPKSHASPDTTYGKGDSKNYGHVKLSDSVDDQRGEGDGVAATPSAVKAAYDKANDASTTAGEAKEAANGKAPKDHKTTTTEYGAGDANNYGHVKLSSSTSSNSGTTGGIAATPSAVKEVNDKKLDKAGGTMEGPLVAQNNTGYAEKQVRNIITLEEGEALPSAASGDFCFFYIP